MTGLFPAYICLSTNLVWSYIKCPVYHFKFPQYRHQPEILEGGLHTPVWKKSIKLIKP